MARESLSVVQVPRKQTLLDALAAGMAGYSEAYGKRPELLLKGAELESQIPLRRAQQTALEMTGSANAALRQAQIENLRKMMSLQRYRASTERIKAFRQPAQKPVSQIDAALEEMRAKRTGSPIPTVQQPQTQRIKMRRPDGALVSVSVNSLDEALANGYTEE